MITQIKGVPADDGMAFDNEKILEEDKAELKDKEGGFLSRISVHDTSMYNTTVFNIGENPKEFDEIYVGDPVVKRGKTFYLIKSVDSKGPFETSRRYSEFDSFR